MFLNTTKKTLKGKKKSCAQSPKVFPPLQNFIISPRATNPLLGTHVFPTYRELHRNKMMNPIFVDIGNYLWEIDVNSKNTGLIRQHAMTVSEIINPYLVLVREFPTQNRLFFFVKVKNYPGGWIKIDLDQGDNIQKN